MKKAQQSFFFERINQYAHFTINSVGDSSSIHLHDNLPLDPGTKRQQRNQDSKTQLECP
jgi:hypothetical protein